MLVLLPPNVAVDVHSGSPRLLMREALAVEGDDVVDDVPAMDTSQGWDPVSSVVDDLRYSEPSTAGASHSLSLLHDCKLWGPIQVVACD